MSQFCDDVRSCRVDFFKPSGKWYTTEAIVFPDETWEMSPVDALKLSIDRQIGTRLSEMTAVCLNPYVKHCFPVMVRRQ